MVVVYRQVRESVLVKYNDHSMPKNVLFTPSSDAELLISWRLRRKGVVSKRHDQSLVGFYDRFVLTT
jgi:hypothetical protein